MKDVVSLRIEIEASLCLYCVVLAAAKERRKKEFSSAKERRKK